MFEAFFFTIWVSLTLYLMNIFTSVIRSDPRVLLDQFTELERTLKLSVCPLHEDPAGRVSYFTGVQGSEEPSTIDSPLRKSLVCRTTLNRLDRLILHLLKSALNILSSPQHRKPGIVLPSHDDSRNV